MINKKWQNSSKNCRAFCSYERVASDQRIVTAYFKLSLRSNKTKTNKAENIDWTNLNIPDIQNRFVNEVRNKFDLKAKHRIYQPISYMNISRLRAEKLQKK